MIRSVSLCLLLVLVVVTRVTCAQPMNYEDLVKLIESKNVRSIEELLPLLPESTRQGYTLMHTSQSNQSASPLEPRVILFGEDASMVLAFSSGSQEADKNSLEIIQYRPGSQSFEFREILFSDNPSDSPRFSGADPEKCKKCHTRNLRPNWDTYSRWAGAYFGMDDQAHLEKDRKKLQTYFKIFLERSASHPRYQHLVDLKKGYTFFGGRVEYRHNITLGTFLSEYNYKRLERIIKATPDYDVFKYAILGAYQGCETIEIQGGRDQDYKVLATYSFTDFLPESLREEFKKVKNTLDKEYPTQKAYYDELKLFLSLFEARDISTEGWTMNINGPPSMISPMHSRNDFTWHLVHDDPDLAPLFNLLKLEDFVRGEMRLYPSAQRRELNESKFCEALRRKSVEALKNWKPKASPLIRRGKIPDSH